MKKRINNNIVKEDPVYYSSRKGNSGSKNTIEAILDESASIMETIKQ